MSPWDWRRISHHFLQDYLCSNLVYWLVGRLTSCLIDWLIGFNKYNELSSECSCLKQWQIGRWHWRWEMALGTRASWMLKLSECVWVKWGMKPCLNQIGPLVPLFIQYGWTGLVMGTLEPGCEVMFLDVSCSESSRRALWQVACLSPCRVQLCLPKWAPGQSPTDYSLLQRHLLAGHGPGGRSFPGASLSEFYCCWAVQLLLCVDWKLPH